MEMFDETGRYTVEGNDLSCELEEKMSEIYKDLRSKGIRGSDAELLMTHAVGMASMMCRDISAILQKPLPSS